MHFGLNEEQELLQETVRGFAAGECPPARVRELFDAGSGFDAALWSGLAEMGMAGLVVPEEHDGAGLGVLELALVAEVLGEAALPGPLVPHALACLALARGGTPAQQAAWLPRLASGDVVATLAFGEQDGRFEPDAWSCTLDDGKLSGTKAYVPHADRADVAVVGIAGGGLALAPLDDARRVDQAGIDRGRPIGTLYFDHAAAEALGDGSVASTVRDAALVAYAADAFGAATRLVTLSAAYAKERKQFGFPIAQFQSVKHQLARIGTDVEPTRALWWYAAHALDVGGEDASRAAALANAHVTDRAMQAARMAVELHGGLGFTWECDVQIYFKRAMLDRAFLGTPEQLRERYAALSGW